jgi:hypothetical protein
MAIVIKKKGGATVTPAPLVEDPPAAPPSPPYEHIFVKPGSKPKKCPGCGNMYLRPCTEAEYPSCGNYKHKLKLDEIAAKKAAQEAAQETKKK